MSNRLTMVSQGQVQVTSREENVEEHRIKSFTCIYVIFFQQKYYTNITSDKFQTYTCRHALSSKILIYIEYEHDSRSLRTKNGLCDGLKLVFNIGEVLANLCQCLKPRCYNIHVVSLSRNYNKGKRESTPFVPSSLIPILLMDSIMQFINASIFVYKLSDSASYFLKQTMPYTVEISSNGKEAIPIALTYSSMVDKTIKLMEYVQNQTLISKQCKKIRERIIYIG